MCLSITVGRRYGATLCAGSLALYSTGLALSYTSRIHATSISNHLLVTHLGLLITQQVALQASRGIQVSVAETRSQTNTAFGSQHDNTCGQLPYCRTVIALGRRVGFLLLSFASIMMLQNTSYLSCVVCEVSEQFADPASPLMSVIRRKWRCFSSYSGLPCPLT